MLSCFKVGQVDLLHTSKNYLFILYLIDLNPQMNLFEGYFEVLAICASFTEKKRKDKVAGIYR